jgi:hypothetical protein
MNRRHFLSLSAALGASTLVPWPKARLSAQSKEPMVTRWDVTTSEGLDAVAFIGALSGGDLYLEYYAKEAAEFGSRLPLAVRNDLAALRKEADTSGFGLLWPNLATMLSGAGISTIESVIAALAEPETRIRPSLQASEYWDEKDWTWFAGASSRLVQVFSAIRDADFAGYRKKLLGSALDARAVELAHGLSDYDVVRWQRKLSGKAIDPTISIVLLYFSKPHGVRVQGQRFLQAADYNLTTTLRIAAHELLHPPFDMEGRVAKEALAVLAKDPLIGRNVRDHDPRGGYTSLEGYLNEDVCQALDQMIAEALGFARNPADRWNKSDDGMHVLAAGLYALLRTDHWQEAGGSIEKWLDGARKAGKLRPAVLHRVAAGVLGRAPDRLWPLPERPAA